METTLELASPSLPCYPGRHSEFGTAQQSVITTAIIRNIYYRYSDIQLGKRIDQIKYIVF